MGAPHGSQSEEAGKAAEAEETGEAEQGEQGPATPAAEAKPRVKPRGKVPELPEKFEAFLEIFSRAFAPPSGLQEVAGDQILLRQVAESVWARLHVYGAAGAAGGSGAATPWSRKQWRLTTTWAPRPRP